MAMTWSFNKNMPLFAIRELLFLVHVGFPLVIPPFTPQALVFGSIFPAIRECVYWTSVLP